MCARKKRSPPPDFATIKGTWDRNHYVMLFDDQLDSPAYIALSAHAKEAYTIIRQQYKGDYTLGFQVICPYSTFQEKGMRPNTISRALVMLEVFGFIRIDHGGLEHQPNVYHLIQDWKKIQTPEDVKRVKDRFKELMDRKNKVIKDTKEESTGYGKYIRSNESVSNSFSDLARIANGSVSKKVDLSSSSLTEPIAGQLTKALAENERRNAYEPINTS